jgi:hypothetical protein
VRPPNFDDLISEDGVEERERLRHVHEMLVTAGPPAELAPEIEQGPTLGMTLGGPSHRRVTRRAAPIAAAVIVLLVAFLAGYITGNDGSPSGRVLSLAGTANAPGPGEARVEGPTLRATWPMTPRCPGTAEAGEGPEGPSCGTARSSRRVAASSPLVARRPSR